MTKKIKICIFATAISIGLLFLLNFIDFKKVKEDIAFFSSKSVVKEENGHRKEIGAITFKYSENQESIKAIDEALNALNQNESLFNNLFGEAALEAPISIVLVENPSDLQKLFGKAEDGYIDGIYLYKRKSIYTAVPKDEKDISEYKRTIVHEYTHHLLTSTLDDLGIKISEIPVWFHEGLAAYIERKDLGINMDEIESLKTVSFEELETHKQWNKHLRSPYNPYIQSQMLVGTIIKKEGNSIIQSILQGSQTNQFNLVFEQTMGKAVTSYETETLSILKDLPLKLNNVSRHLYQEKDPESALELVLNINETIPNVNQVMTMLSITYLEMGNYEKAIDHYKSLVKLFPTSAYYHQLANALLFRDLDQAIGASKLSVKLADQESVNFYQEYAINLNRLKESVTKGKPLEGYLSFIKNEDTLTDTNKIHLIVNILKRYPESTEGRNALISFKQSLRK
ncbi:hypothetical protein A8F94_00550 [Bacillus sp. FJAT-27225]|uniref:tetratricopeptide repeat protein n=1 Tax=Bacillus sp. FJAT-27225 TaxID=1743144 RepID=UPI00080C2DDA|nr:hypothetical protein [Bacillus sp. FJAT-27225]OCA90417.1 hypothetical protein A8F94_00550 [Bacillus sp. FJAT-27225]